VSITFGPKRSLCFFTLDPKVFSLKNIITRTRSPKKDSERVEGKEERELKSVEVPVPNRPWTSTAPRTRDWEPLIYMKEENLFPTPFNR
ncbi:hypothetical protein L345_03461, partial [Ophiophagus hannah]